MNLREAREVRHVTVKQTKRQRIKRDDLVQFVFSVFSQRYERSSVDSIYDLKIPVAEIRRQLSEQYETEYHNDWWIMTQLHRYERETGTRLFERVDADLDPDSITLAIYKEIDGYRQLHHLFTNQKIRIANGVLGIINNTVVDSIEPTTLFLGSGSIPATLADVLIRQVAEHGRRYHVYSHNLAVQEKFLAAHIDADRLEFFAIGGRIDPTMYISMTDDVVSSVHRPLDFVVQSTNAISDGLLYVSDEGEAELKGRILHDLPGTKILMVVKDEFGREASGKPYGSLHDYDYIVTVPSKNGTSRRADRYLLEQGEVFQPHIVHWSYHVYRVEDGCRSTHGSIAPAYENHAVYAYL